MSRQRLSVGVQDGHQRRKQPDIRPQQRRPALASRTDELHSDPFWQVGHVDRRQHIGKRISHVRCGEESEKCKSVLSDVFFCSFRKLFNFDREFLDE